MIVSVKCIPALVSPIDTIRVRAEPGIDPTSRPWAYTARIQFRFLAPNVIDVERAVKWISAAHHWTMDVPPSARSRQAKPLNPQ